MWKKDFFNLLELVFCHNGRFYISTKNMIYFIESYLEKKTFNVRKKIINYMSSKKNRIAIYNSRIKKNGFGVDFDIDEYHKILFVATVNITLDSTSLY